MGLSSDDLHKVLQEYATSPRLAATDKQRGRHKTEAERKELQQWMEDKRRERGKEYQRNKAELRGTERHPFDIKAMVNGFSFLLKLDCIEVKLFLTLYHQAAL